MRLIPFLFLTLATPALAQQQGPELDRARYDGCVNAVATQAVNALEFAQGWHLRGGGLPARHCAALAFLHLERYADAARTLETAGREAEDAKAPQAADFWGQAGNAWFLAQDMPKARAAFDRAIPLSGAFAPKQKAALHVDRARAAAEAGDLAAARTDLDQATLLSPDDPVAIMLSASLARRQNDLPRATHEIARASELAPGDVDVMLEQAQIAAANGDADAARRVLEHVIKAAPGSPAADIATRSLAAN